MKSNPSDKIASVIDNMLDRITVLEMKLKKSEQEKNKYRRAAHRAQSLLAVCLAEPIVKPTPAEIAEECEQETRNGTFGHDGFTREIS